jgi:esterase/lipase superfamily enzyme
MPQCQAVTKSGVACKNTALLGASYCQVHQGQAGSSGTVALDAAIANVDIRKKLQELEQKIEKIEPAKKDAWDKFDLIGKFLASVLLVAIGGTFTYLYNSSQQEKDRQLSIERQQTYQLETVSKFLPYLSNEKEEIRRTAILGVQVLVGTELATRLALVQVGPDTPATLSSLRDRGQGAERTIPDQALKDLVATGGQFSVIRTFFMTVRAPVAGPNLKFGSEKGKAQYGVSDVSIPRSHKVGQIERPNLFGLELSEDREKHLTVTSLQTLAEDKYFETLNSLTGKDGSSDVLVFIPGFNMTFEDGSTRLAEITYDLSFNCIPIFFSWPSLASVSGYMADEETADWSANSLADFLGAISTRFKGKKIHLIAQSLGARTLLSALAIFSRSPEKSQDQPFSDIVLVSPDIDAAVYRQSFGMLLPGLANRVTVYTSKTDPTMLISERIHGSPRVGSDLVVLPGIDTIEVVRAGASFIGSLSERSILADLHALFVNRLPPSQRANLRMVQNNNISYWQLEGSQ